MASRLARDGITWSTRTGRVYRRPAHRRRPPAVGQAPELALRQPEDATSPPTSSLHSSQAPLQPRQPQRGGVAGAATMHPTVRSPSRRLGVATVLVVLGTLAGGMAASPAGATPLLSGELTVVGHGWGHGIGMGQWGALGYAIGQDNGVGTSTYQQIVSHYYAPATLVQAAANDNQPVTIALTENDGAAVIAIATDGAGVTVPGRRPGRGHRVPTGLSGLDHGHLEHGQLHGHLRGAPPPPPRR